MPNSIDFPSLQGGLDSRISYLSEQESPKLLFCTKSQNVEINNYLLSRMNGNVPVLNTPTGHSITGMFESDYNDIKTMYFVSGYNFYRYNNDGTYNSLKSNIVPNSKPVFCQYLQNVCVTNGNNDPFIYDPISQSIKKTNFQAQTNATGALCASFSNRLVISDKTTIYLSSLGDYTSWTNNPNDINSGFSINNFISNTDKITGMANYANYLAIFTSQHIYLLSGTDNNSFSIIKFGNVGSSSPNGSCIFNRNMYFFGDTNLGVYLSAQFSDLGSLRVGDSITRRVYPDFVTTIDKTQLNKIIFVPYINKNKVYMYVPNSQTGLIDTAYVYDFNYTTSNSLVPDLLPIWKRVQNPITSACSFQNNVYTGTSTGQIYLEDVGNSFAGNSFDFNYYTPYFDLGDRASFKQAQYIKFFFNSTRVNNVGLVINTDNKNNATNPRAMSVSDNFFTLGQDSLASSKLTTISSENSKLMVPSGRWTSLQFGITGNSSVNDFSLRMFSITGLQNYKVV
jgi:hypothetical protein